MAGSLKYPLRLPRPFAWLHKLETLLARELTPTSRKLRTACRMTTMGAIGAGLVTACHVNNEFGTYIVWLLVGAGPMMSARTASKFLIAEAICLCGAVIMARALAETPWLMLPFLFALVSIATYIGTVLKLGAGLLLIEVLSINALYGVVYAPQDIGWDAAGAFGGSVLAFGVLILFDNWLWPDPGERVLTESLGTSLARDRSRLLDAASFYLGNRSIRRPPLPPATSDLPSHMALLEQAMAEGISEYRHAILLAAITRVARIGFEVDRLTIAARQYVPANARAMVQSQIEAAVEAIASALDEIAHELPTRIAVGVDKPPSPSRMRARSAMDALAARIIQVRPAYIHVASSAELENFATVGDSLGALTGLIEHLLDEPPRSLLTVAPKQAAPRLLDAPDPTLVRFCLKVGMCTIAGYTLGVFTQRPELATILVTILITALPTYGAAFRKMVLRIVGALIGGIISLAAIIVVTPNFTTLPAYMLTLFVVFFVSAYCSLSSGRIAYAGKQIGTTFALVFTGLGPPLDIYVPLWRIWGILLGTFVVAAIAFVVWPEYAGDSLLPRLRQVIRDTLALIPGDATARTELGITKASTSSMRLLAEILNVANDAEVEGRSSLVNHNAIVEAAGTLRRIANRLGSISSARISTPVPELDPATEAAREEALNVVRRELHSWLDFFSGDKSFNRPAAQALAHTHAPQNLAQPVERFNARIEEGEFARIAGWTLAQRQAILAELHSMRRLEFLFGELNLWLPRIPGPASMSAGAG
ncbi:MAG TPA: FUSC family protein [Candidatus Binataceae bacterium]|nr:FUSC family protein [Candidatus Binataceae bacterium]